MSNHFAKVTYRNHNGQHCNAADHDIANVMAVLLSCSVLPLAHAEQQLCWLQLLLQMASGEGLPTPAAAL
jgi:hypothetical protein